MILIADSGSTKTDWIMVENGHVMATAQSRGLNPFSTDENDFAITFSESTFFKNIFPEKIFFYGSGCATENNKLFVKVQLRKFFTHSDVEVYSDLLAASRALFGNKPGISCIIGTGSSAAYYDGTEVLTMAPSLGYVVGDEGSGCYLGKELVKAFFYKQMPKNIEKDFEEKFKLTREELLINVYRKKHANAYLARFTTFMNEHAGDDFISAIILKSFEAFYQNQIRYLLSMHELPIGFNGSVAYYFRNYLDMLAIEKKFKIQKIIRTPAEGLVDYHCLNLN